MATTLDNGNVDKIKRLIPKEGFRTKFWREYRANACKGSGVGKALDNLATLGVPPSGDPAKAKLDKMPQIIEGYNTLSSALLKARGKCGKLQKHSREFCVAFSKVVEVRYEEAVKLAKGGAAKLMAEEMLSEDRKELERKKKEEQALSKIKELISKSVKTMQAVDTTSKTILNATKKAISEIETKMDAWVGGREREGVDKVKLDATMEQVIKKIASTYKVKNNHETLKKLKKEGEAAILAMKKAEVGGIEQKILDKAVKVVAEGRNSFESAQKLHHQLVKLYQDSLNDVTEAKRLAGKNEGEQVEGH